MAFDSQVSAQFGAALATLRDEASNQTGWSVVDDGSDGGNLSLGDYFVLETAAPAEQIRIHYESVYGGVAIEHGLDWDASTESWNDRWTYDPMNTEQGDTETEYTVIPKASDDDNPTQPTDNGAYWFLRLERGFGFYYQREEGDGDDEDIFIGMAQVDKAWNYDTATTREAEWVLGFGDSQSSYQQLTYMSNSGEEDSSGDPIYRPGNNTYEARGTVNPDNNFDNYPLTNSILSSSRYRNVEDEDTVIGTSDLWVADNSGGDTGHRDLVQDAEGNNIYTILTRQTPTPAIALRMVDTLP